MTMKRNKTTQGEGNMSSTKSPVLPSIDAPMSERVAWHERYLKWLVEHREPELIAKYGKTHAAHCMEQERFVAGMFIMTPEQLEAGHRAAQERLRNLLGRDYEIEIIDET
jgi:hypothetical protein